MLNVSTLCGTARSRSDPLRYGMALGVHRRTESASARRPVVVWNLTRACNLACRHCYASARPRPDIDELDFSEALGVIESLSTYRIPALLLSGGEPLARPDFIDILEAASGAGLQTTLSTNGTLIDGVLASRIAAAGIGYVGVSLDGSEILHDKLRCVRGAWRRSVDALVELGRAGVKRGVRFTLAPSTVEGLPAVLRTVSDLGVERFCLYHLVPSGRGKRLDDISPIQRIAALYTVFEFAASTPGVEVLTVANPSDAVAFYLWLRKRDPARAESAYELMAWNGGARHGSGVALACIDERGTVYPDQFSRHRPIGSVKTEPFDRLWERWREHRLGLDPAARLPEKCRGCRFFAICGGGFRVRAELSTGDPAGFDPSCIVDEVTRIAA